MASQSDRNISLIHITTVPWSLYFLRGQTAEMQGRGIDITIGSSPEPSLDQFGESEGVQTRGIRMMRAISPFRDIRSIWDMCRAFRDIRPNIVHAHTPKGGLIGMISSFLMRTPVRIYHIRGLPYMTETGRNRHLLRWSEKLSCLLAHEVFCVSHSIRDVAIQDGLAPSDKIKVFLGGSGNGVDASSRFNPESFSDEERAALRGRLGIGAGEQVIMYVGRLVKDKGVEELVRAWRTLRDRFPSSRLIMAGPFEPKDAISDASRDYLENDSRVVLLGDVPDPAPYYSIADLVVLPTYREGFPNVPLEAAAMEVPVVATTIPGCTDAVEDGVTGTLVPPRDVDALRGAIERYLDHPDLRRAHGLAGRERVLREFRQEDIWEAIFQEYCRLLEERGLPLPEPRRVLVGAGG